MRLLSGLVLVAVCFAACNAGTIWESCWYSNGIHLCADLVQQSLCDFHLKVTAESLFTVIDQDVDLSVSNPTVCGYWPSTSSCLVCVNLNNITRLNSQNVSVCAEATYSCLALREKLPCYLDTSGALAQCVYATCPNGCSGNGRCVGGTCNCNVGYSGADCSQNQLAYAQCAATDYGQACLNIQFEQCAIEMSLTLAGIPVYKTSNPVMASSFGPYFASPVCITPAPGCQACLGFSNFQLNTTYMTGCPSLNMTCLGTKLGPYQYDCFTDTQLSPACFGDCAGCSGHGTCNNGICTCNSGYSGALCDKASCASVRECSGQGTCTSPNVCDCNDGFSGSDCSVVACGGCSGHGKCLAPNNCTCDVGFTGQLCDTPYCTNPCYNNGQCVKGQCVCAKGWTGSDCSVKTNQNQNSGSGSGVYVGVGIAVGLGLAAVGGGGYLYWRKRQGQRYGSAAFDDGLLQVPSSDGDQ